MMKAAIRRNYGMPKDIQIEQIKTPSPNDDEVLIKIKSTTVNRTDGANLTAKPFIMRLVLGLRKPRKAILGTDYAGEIIAAGKNVTGFSNSDRVFGFYDLGSESQAEYKLSSKEHLFLVPDHVNFQEAAASLEGGHYAYSFIHKVDIKKGQRILINGASGGIGSALIQFVRKYKVHISATCATKNIGLIQGLGADKVYDYTKEDFLKSGEKFDYIFDAVGKSTFNKCKPLLNEKGVYISSELGPFAQNVIYALTTRLFNKKRVIFPIPYATKRTIPFIIQQLKDKSFKPVIDRTYSLDDIAKAYDYVMQGNKTGNVIINV